MALLHPDWPVTTRVVAGGVLTFVHPSSPVNGARGLGLTGPLSENDLMQVEGFFGEHRSAVRIDVCPSLDSSLPGRLSDRGYRRRDSLAVLYRPLQPPLPLPPAAVEIQVTHASSDQGGLWISTTASGFDASDDPHDRTLSVLAGNFSAANSIPYLAWIRGKAVGGGALFVDDRAAELGSDSTLPAFRKRGVHTALIATRLVEASRMGLDLAVFCAEPESESQHNAERLGFQVAYLIERMAQDLKPIELRRADQVPL
jgi:predicted GNAT family acetyltransferase